MSAYLGLWLLLALIAGRYAVVWAIAVYLITIQMRHWANR